MSPLVQSHQNLLACLTVLASFGRCRARELGLLAWPSDFAQRDALVRDATLSVLGWGRILGRRGERVLSEAVAQLAPEIPSATLAALMKQKRFTEPAAAQSRKLVCSETGLATKNPAAVLVPEISWLEARTVAVEAVDNALIARVFRCMKRAVEAKLVQVEREGVALPYYTLTTKGSRYLARETGVDVAATVGCGDGKLLHKAVAETYIIHRAREGVAGREVLNEFALGRDQSRPSPWGVQINLSMSVFRTAFGREPDGLVVNVKNNALEVVEAENSSKVQAEFAAAMECVSGADLLKLNGLRIGRVTFVLPNERNRRTLCQAARDVFLGEGKVRFAGRTGAQGAAQVAEFEAFLERIFVAEVRLSERRFIPLGVLRTLNLKAVIEEIGPLADLLAARGAWE